MNAQELLENLNLLDEHERVEAKSASEVGRSVLETVCAFANEPGLGGGWILLGVEREEDALFPAYQPVGVLDPDKISADLASQCRSTFNTTIRPSISTENIHGKNVLVVFVPEAQAQEKPVFFQSKGLPKGAFRRIGSTDQKCTEDDLAIMYQGRGAETFDASIIPDAEMDDIESEALLDYRATREDANPDAEELRWSDQELLQALGAIKRNAQSEWKPTVAGIILFGKRTALRRLFPMTRVDYIRVAGKEWLADPGLRFETTELRDPIFRLIRRTQAAILDDLPKTFGLAEGDLQRSDTPAIPQKVIREALVNALMHRNYRSNMPIQIIRYANRIEIRNPGFSLKSPEHLGEPGSDPRNPKIAAVLHETRFAETKGSGIRVMRDLMDQAGLTPPLFESDREKDHFVARYFFHHFLGEDDIKWLSRFKEHHLNDNDAKALIVVREAGAIDNATYRELGKVDTLTASSALRRLRDAGLLAQQGRGSATYYVPTPRLGLDAGSLFDNPPGLSDNPPGLSDNPFPPSGNASLPALHVDSPVDRQKLLGLLSGELAARVGELGKRSPPYVVQDVIVEVCRFRSWRTEELAALLKRNPRHVSNSYLRPLMRDGRIEMTNPKEPNDPQQGYRTTQRPAA